MVTRPSVMAVMPFRNRKILRDRKGDAFIVEGVGVNGLGSVHVIDIPARRVKQTFQAGTGCESLGFY